jgi:hypothetical protein
MRVQIFIAKDQLAATFRRPLRRDPEGAGVTQV